MKKKIITDLKYLKQKSLIAIPEEVDSIIKDLEDSLDLSKGIGLSAIQIGIPKQVGIIRIPELKININLINPEIIDREDRFHYIKEGCLSIPGVKVDTSRYREITFYNNLQRTYTLSVETDGLVCIAVQHEIDHMKGLIILDRKWKNTR